MSFSRYKAYDIQSVTIPRASGRWQVEVRIFSHDGRQVVAQGHLLPDDYATEAEALQAGIAYGRQWVDDSSARNQSMSLQDAPLDALLRESGMSHCPTCQTPITPATVQVGWTYHPVDYPFGPLTWLVCRARVDKGPGHRFCEHRLRRRDIPPGRVVETDEDAIAVLRGT